MPRVIAREDGIRKNFVGVNKSGNDTYGLCNRSSMTTIAEPQFDDGTVATHSTGYVGCPEISRGDWKNVPKG